jgi:hypothetical protein
MMITYFDLARIDQDNRIWHVSSRLRMSMSPQNATRLLGILGAEEDCTFLHPREMHGFLQRAISEHDTRAASGDVRTRYELPRLVQLQCLFQVACSRGYGVQVWQDAAS